MPDILLSDGLLIPDRELDFQPIRASGPGGQNVNKVASAVQLRFDVTASSLPEEPKARLLAMRDRRIGTDGVITIKAQRHRSQEQNRADACERLRDLIEKVLVVRAPRRATRPSRASVQRRLEGKRRRAGLKALRGSVERD